MKAAHDADLCYCSSLADGRCDFCTGLRVLVNVYRHGLHTRLAVTPKQLENVVARCGWMVVDGIENRTAAVEAELSRIEAQGYAEISDGSRKWWTGHTVSERQLAVA